ncbi:hypothetical protein K2P96_01990, partial [Patescibacteria group bacterium]|nr:hypothetical protein [Patescibacteria group bacterium]
LERHLSLALEMMSGDRLNALADEMEKHMQFSLLLDYEHEAFKAATDDAIWAIGELLSSQLLASSLLEFGIPAKWIDARNVMLTDSEHGNAEPDLLATYNRVEELVLPVLRGRQVPIIGGYIGSSRATGLTTTLGLDGSDYSAAVLAASITDVVEVQKWTDTAWVMDSKGKIRQHLSIDEARGLCPRDGKQLFHSGMLRAVDSGDLQIRVCNSKTGECGTVVSGRSS